MNQYPVRPKFFAHRFVRLLAKCGAANELGSGVCWMLTTIAMLEDSKRYSGHVTFYNEQLMALCAFGGRDRLLVARNKAIASGWLHYEQGGKSIPGKYWVTIPAQYQEINDGDFDDSSICRPETGQQPGRQTDGKRDDKPAPYKPIPNPNPKESQLRFDDDDFRFAEMMFAKVRQVIPKTKKPDLDKWSNEIRMMREIDGHTLCEIQQVFDWANRDHFWSLNVRSPKSLRKQFAVLHAKTIQPASRNGQAEPAPIRFNDKDAI